MRIHRKSFTPKKGLSWRKVKRQETAAAAPSATHALTAEECKSYAKECKGTYQDTFLSWDFLVDLKLAGRYVKLVDRFNMTREYLHNLVDVKKPSDVVRCLVRSAR
jgi:hypothetical protein